MNDAFCVLREFLEPLLGKGRSPQEWSSKHRSLLPLQVGPGCKVWSLCGSTWGDVSFDTELVQVCAINWLGGFGASPKSPRPERKAGGNLEVEELSVVSC